jgi:quinol monooxygenase YgiN
MTFRKSQRMEAQAIPDPSLPKVIRTVFVAVVHAWLLCGIGIAHAQEQQMMVRISEIQVHREHLEQYKAVLKEEAEASIRLEPGVIAIVPMFQRESDTEFRILEIYANRQAYESHLKTPHFQKYKFTTTRMVKSLKLVDMQSIDAKSMISMFKKMEIR